MKQVFKFLGIAAVVVLAATLFLRLQKAGEVEAVHPVRGEAVQAVYATGTVEAGTMLPIAARSGARLSELLADEGQKVAKDEVLARLEDEDLQQTLREAEVRAALAEKELARKTGLLKTGAVSEQAVDQAKADYDAARAAVGRAKAQVGFLQLKAPADGTIIRRDGEVGELIPANQPVFWVACCTALRVEAEVDEEDISLVKIGQKALLSADAFPGQVFEGTVQSITPKGDPVARSYRVRIVFTEETPLMIGMTAEANIIIRIKQNALMVPRSAVTEGKVWAVRDGRLARVPVTTGITTPKAVEITAGLTEEDAVLSEPGEDLEEGARVRARIPAREGS